MEYNYNEYLIPKNNNYYFIRFFKRVDTKKLLDWSSTNFTKSNSTQENNEQPADVLPSGPIDLNQLLKSKNDAYLKQLISPKCFPVIMMAPGFDDSALAEQEENAPFNIISLPVIINDTEANDVRILFLR